jgi:ABC-type transport system involved in cytochrome c biogenesis permease subunit
VRWWLDPKVLFSLSFWLAYGCYMLMRKLGGWGGRKAAWWAFAGLVWLLINYFVINVLSRTHRFGV